jgi:nitrate reductase NapE component
MASTEPLKHSRGPSASAAIQVGASRRRSELQTLGFLLVVLAILLVLAATVGAGPSV